MGKSKKEIISIGTIVIVGVVVGLIALVWTKIGGSLLILISLLIIWINKNLKDFLINFFSRIFNNSNKDRFNQEMTNSPNSTQIHIHGNKNKIINS